MVIYNYISNRRFSKYTEHFLFIIRSRKLRKLLFSISQVNFNDEKMLLNSLSINFIFVFSELYIIRIHQCITVIY
jgi:type IV secretory pathway VirD2 relaxase